MLSEVGLVAAAGIEMKFVRDMAGGEKFVECAVCLSIRQPGQL